MFLTTISAESTEGTPVFAGAFGLGSKVQSYKSNETVNRIQFSVPVALPIATERHNVHGLSASR